MSKAKEINLSQDLLHEIFDYNGSNLIWKADRGSNTAAKKYMASIKFNYKNIYLGLYNTEEEARQAYLDAKKVYHIID